MICDRLYVRISELRIDTKPMRLHNNRRLEQDMIQYAATLPAGQERDSLEVYIAQCMRQRNLVWNRDQEAGINRVKEDIIRLSDGKLRCESAVFEQMMAQPNAPMKGVKKKK